jgi:coenzyme F420-0:L-glutamate ligase / coenzyme F420-1:gamma-L-glutamate ligase
VSIIPVPIEGELEKGDRIADRIVRACADSAIELIEADVVVVTHKIVSKAEGRVAQMEQGDYEARDALIDREGAAILRRRGDMVITRTRHGFVCASAGIDASNVAPGTVTLLPLDPDRSARGIRSRLRRLTGVELAVIVSDTFGRAWRVGQTNVAIGLAGMLPTINYRDSTDSFGTLLRVTNIAVADEIAGAAELVMGKSDGIPVAIVRGVAVTPGHGSAKDLVRPVQDDLFL